MKRAEEKLTVPKAIGMVIGSLLLPIEVILGIAWVLLVFLWSIVECCTVCISENVLRCTPKWAQKRWPCGNRREFDANKLKWRFKSEYMDKVTVFYRYADGVYLEKEYPRSMETEDMVNDMTKIIDKLSIEKVKS